MNAQDSWRPIIAALSNPDMRVVIAKLILGSTLDEALEGHSPSKRRKLHAALDHAGLLADTGTAEVLDTGVFAAILASGAKPKREGRERFLDGTRIVQFPSQPAEREELLAWVADQVIRRDEVLSEAMLNERLLAHSDDVALLRRYLVDFELLERRADGTEYTRVARHS